MANSTRVLVVDDDPATCQLLEDALRRRGFDVMTRLDADQAIELSLFDDFHVVVADVQMHGASGIELCRQLKQSRPDVPVIIMSGFASQDTVIEAMRAGAHDFVTKPFEVDLLQIAIERADRHRRLRSEICRLRSQIPETQQLQGLIGRSRPMRMLTGMISQTAPTEATVLITGESGSGKELVARAIHAESRRANGPFVAINCGAVPETLLESELFGHESGAFTDAKSAKNGLFVAANGGTLFLDEIGEMPLGMQVKLLRALQERRVRPLGAAEDIPFNTRIIAATNRDLDSEVDEGRFRSDLFYRLNVVRVEVPPLRARGNDVLLLAQYFLARSAEAKRRNITGFARDVTARMAIYPFPGNVRELENVIERAVALASAPEIQLSDLPDTIRSWRHTGVGVDVDASGEMISVDELERRYFDYVLRSVAGNKTQAAQVLRVDRKTLYRKLRRWNGSEDGAIEGHAS